MENDNKKAWSIVKNITESRYAKPALNFIKRKGVRRTFFIASLAAYGVADYLRAQRSEATIEDLANENGELRLQLDEAIRANGILVNFNRLSGAILSGTADRIRITCTDNNESIVMTFKEAYANPEMSDRTNTGIQQGVCQVNLTPS
ncbi:MAG: hypothetical protein AB7H77_12330 [Bdellovibrionales bacterium]